MQHEHRHAFEHDVDETGEAFGFVALGAVVFADHRVPVGVGPELRGDRDSVVFGDDRGGAGHVVRVDAEGEQEPVGERRVGVVGVRRDPVREVLDVVGVIHAGLPL